MNNNINDNISLNYINETKPCNGGSNKTCVLKGNFRSENAVYLYKITSGSKEIYFIYIELFPREFKSRLANHYSTFKYNLKRNSAGHSKLFISFPRDKGKPFRLLCTDKQFSILFFKHNLVNTIYGASLQV